MTVARSEGINKADASSISNLLKKTFSFRNHFSTVLIEEIRIAKFRTEVFVVPKHFMTKLNIPKSSYTCLHSVQSFYPNSIAGLLCYGKTMFFLHLYLTRGVVQCEI